MKKLIPLSILSLLILSSFSFVKPTPSFHQKGLEGDTIFWSPNTKLAWPDFQGTPPNHSSKAAVTFSGITFDFHCDETCRLRIKTYFVRSQSWKKIEDDTILLHEQGHFDITEISARKFWQKIKSQHLDKIDPKNGKKAYLSIKKIYQEQMNESDKLQEKYDTETDHSKIRKEQVKWLAWIKVQLAELPEF